MIGETKTTEPADTPAEKLPWILVQGMFFDYYVAPPGPDPMKRLATTFKLEEAGKGEG